MSAGEIRLPNPANPTEPPKVFPFDQVFDPLASQQTVFELCAQNIVQACIEGFNGTIFAYGQTGTGKTFSMTGIPSVPDLRGITPRSFGKIFDFVKSRPNCQFLVRASYLEIYNEQIRDLLGDDPKRKLELKQHPQTGVFVKDLTAFAVKDEKEMDEVMTRGSNNRAVASTKMNEGSSRSHAIFSVVVEANEKDDKGQDHIRVGKLNLVDLAGSERAGKTEATGERLKEGCAINLSLVALGNVISALVDGKAKHIPYRDSKLTRLLEDSLGGSAKTAMVANVGPADYNYEETLSTLRYASRAKNIKNKPKINEDPKDALLRELKEEIERLRQELETIGGEGQVALKQLQEVGKSAGIGAQDVAEMRQEASDERVRSMLVDRGVTDEGERNRFLEALRNLRQAESQEKELREAVEAQIRMLEGNICVGGVNLYEENVQMQSEMAEQQRRLAECEEEQRTLQERVEKQREEDFAREEKYATLQEEVSGREAKLKRMSSRVDYYQSEVSSLRREWEREKSDLLQTVRELQVEAHKRRAIIGHLVPEPLLKLLGERCHYDPATSEWSVQGLHLAGNLAPRRGEQISASPEKETSPSSSSSSPAPTLGVSVLYLSVHGAKGSSKRGGGGLSGLHTLRSLRAAAPTACPGGSLVPRAQQRGQTKDNKHQNE